MPFISWLAKSWLGRFALEYLWGKLSGFLLKAYEDYKKSKKIDEESKDSVQPLKDAKTKEEIDNAADSALDKF